MVVAPHHLAAQAGRDVLHDGGNAVEAMVAAAATSDFETHRKPTRREKFLPEMNTAVPWTELCAVIDPE